ncbi:ATP-binding protein [Gloeothece verrucosa]|uniref:ATP-binding protein n=1 Tax=Gloeothece verrucosa TaxID=2546359 RepID=UPI0002DBD4A1|nr:ATP-binding protein [Gloeothece verrucosa]
MEDFDLDFDLEADSDPQLASFKEYAVLHPNLKEVSQALMSAIIEPGGFAHVLVYGPSGVGKTTMIKRLEKRFNSQTNNVSRTPKNKNSVSSQGSLPLLVLEVRSSDDGIFNRANYYRIALETLGEPFYERRLLVDINTEQTWEKKGRSRSKNAQFNDSTELRRAFEDALIKHGVRAVILDEAQHLMKVGNGQSASKLLDQLDWIKSITNVTGVLHVLIGTYELLSFQNLNGQAARRGLDLHFKRYQFSVEQDRRNFQAALLALLKQVPLNTDIESLMQQWFYFYERSIGCVGVLKDWLIRASGACLRRGEDTLTIERIQEYAFNLASVRTYGYRCS